VSEDERRPGKRERPVVISASAAPPAVASHIEAQAGTALGPLPEAKVEISADGEPYVTDLLRAQIRAARMEREQPLERSEREPTSKPPGYERELWERGRSAPEHGRER
jgi:hypothetical protein